MKASGVPPRVLLVEDEALIALDTADALTEGGYVVAGIADRVASALALAETEDLDAAVLDVNLAGEQVWPVAAVLADRGIPFVLLSGLSSQTDVPVRFRNTPWVSKPARHTELMKLLERIRGQGKVNREP